MLFDEFESTKTWCLEVPTLVEIGPVALELLMYFRYYLPLKMGVVLHLHKTWIPNTKGFLVPRMVEIRSVGLEKKIFLMSTMYFNYYLPFKKGCGTLFV